jgi:hypothetical protein
MASSSHAASRSAVVHSRDALAMAFRVWGSPVASALREVRRAPVCFLVCFATELVGSVVSPKNVKNVGVVTVRGVWSLHPRRIYLSIPHTGGLAWAATGRLAQGGVRPRSCKDPFRVSCVSPRDVSLYHYLILRGWLKADSYHIYCTQYRMRLGRDWRGRA